MQINLRQPEIEKALRDYIREQGINLYGKEVFISFTAGRKDTGLSVELNIEDIDVPPPPDSNAEIALDTAQAKVKALVPEVEEVLESPDLIEKVEATDTPKTTSLFG